MSSLTIKDIIFNTFETQTNKDNQAKYSELRNLFKIKQNLYKRTRLKNAKLAQQLRESKEESQQLKLAIARTANKKTKLIQAHQEEINILKAYIAKLENSDTNLEKDNSLSDDFEAVDFAFAENHLQTVNKEHNDEVVSLVLEGSESHETKAVNLKFTPKFQAVLNKYARD